MAQSKNDKTEAAVRKDSKRSDAGDAPFADGRTNPEEVRAKSEDRVGTPVTTSFDERTGVTQPFVKADGTQDNGAADLGEPEGARRASTREGSKTTVEETEKAIKDGVVEGPQRIKEAEDEKPKNPVATESETK